jgi:hypothetical protein
LSLLKPILRFHVEWRGQRGKTPRISFVNCNSATLLDTLRCSAGTEDSYCDSLTRLRTDLNQVEAERPRIREYIDGLKEERDASRQALTEAEFALQAAVAEDDAANSLRDANARAARVVGRVSLYLETLRLSDRNEPLSKAVEEASADIARLTALLDGDADELLASALNSVAGQMTRSAERLDLEHKGQYRLDIKNLTVVVDRAGRSIPMHRMGGGQNWLGCHLVALLALHHHFVTAKSPVPAFLVLDQPTQVYFPSVENYDALSGAVDETEHADADLEAVRRMFELLYSVCDELEGKFQIIVLEHANLPDQRFQDSLVEKEPWSGIGDHALVPESWKRQPTAGDVDLD